MKLPRFSSHSEVSGCTAQVCRFPDDSDTAHKPWSFIFLSASATCLVSVCFETESHYIALIGLEF